MQLGGAAIASWGTCGNKCLQLLNVYTAQGRNMFQQTAAFILVKYIGVLLGRICINIY